MACVLSAVSATANAASYRIDPGGALAKASGSVFTIGEGGVTVSCEKAVAKQPNPTSKELVTKEQSLISSFEECHATVGEAKVVVKIPPEIKLKLSEAEKNEGSSVKWKNIMVTVEKDVEIELMAGCVVKIPAASNKALKGMSWEDVNTKPGSYLSNFSPNISNGAYKASAACAVIGVKTEGVWKWIWEHFEQGGEGYN